ncbi:MAG: sensor histidine kinase [Gammaproteobacteria bacterium]|nr:sensor histidine kinase [Gammaproteobacteria bacterium]
MFIVFVQCIGFAYYAQAGFFSSMNSPWTLLFFAFGFIPLPVIWLDLVYTRNWAQLGVTRYYEDTVAEKWPRWMAGYYQCIDPEREKPKNVRKRFLDAVFCNVYSYATFLFIYLISPITFIHVRHNFENPVLKNNAGRWLQAGQDISVIISIVIFFVCILSMALHPLLPNISYHSEIIVGSLLFLVLSALVLGAVPVFSLPMTTGTKPITVVLLSGYFIVLLLDLSGVGKFNIIHITGGYTPCILLALIGWVTHIFVTELKQARRMANKVMKEGIRTNLADRSLHHFGNYLQAPTTILASLQREIADIETVKQLALEPDRLDILLGRIGNARVALDGAQKLINEMKSKVRMAHKPAWINPAGFLATLQLSKDIGKNRRLTLNINPGPDGVELNVEEKKFQQIIQNLLENAVSAIRSQPPREPEIEISLIYEKDEAYPLSIIIRDNGPGIPKKLRERIYDAYFSTKGAGSGLGLYLAREFIGDSNGKIHLDTRTGSDSQTKFTLQFPERNVRFILSTEQKKG